MIKIQSLQQVSPSTLYGAFAKAFKDYELQLSQEELEAMLYRRGFVPSLSYGAFDNNRLIAFTFNGIGDYYGVPTAYDTGTGTIEEYRGRGIATEIFNHAVPLLKKEGVQQYLLEVLQDNSKAVSVYRKLGFRVSREFNYFVRSLNLITLPDRTVDESFMVRKSDLSEIHSMVGFWDFQPSWQNSIEAIYRKPGDFELYVAMLADQRVGYCVIEPSSGDITQLAVMSQFRRKGVATMLLRSSLSSISHHSIKMINYEVGVDSVTAFMEHIGIVPMGTQYEMIRSL